MDNIKTKPLFYFSGTGGCLATAQRISNELPEFSLFPIAALNDGFTVDADEIGFVFPLYYAGLPRIVANFIRKIKFTRPCYIFAVVACGFPWSGYAMHQLNRLLNKKKQRLSAGFYLAMVDNFLPHYDVPSAEQLNDIYRKCEEKLETILTRIRHRDTFVEPDKALHLYSFYPIFINALKRYDKHFKTDGRCSRCGVCQNVCPVNNIEIAGATPVWQHHCEFCLACISYCPKQTIQWKNVTQTKGRYHYKGISSVEIAKQKQLN